MNTDEHRSLEPHDPLEAQVEVMVTEHLSAKLSGQVGRAAAAFGAAMNRQTHAHEVKRTRRMLYWFAIPAAVAACVAVTLVMTRTEPAVEKGGDGGVGGGVAKANEERKIDSTTYYRDIDAGVRMVSDGDKGQMPVRQIRRQSFSETQWYDPAEKATMSVTVPREDVVYVKVQPF